MTKYEIRNLSAILLADTKYATRYTLNANYRDTQLVRHPFGGYEIRYKRNKANLGKNVAILRI